MAARGSGRREVPAVAGVVSFWCDDEEGDPLTARVTREPEHGRAGPIVMTEGAYGERIVTIPYVPDLGFEPVVPSTAITRVRPIDGLGRPAPIRGGAAALPT